jgi:hypothetical protein
MNANGFSSIGGAALTYLDANGLNLMKSKHDDESSFIGKARGCSCFILTHDMLARCRASECNPVCRTGREDPAGG